MQGEDRYDAKLFTSAELPPDDVQSAGSKELTTRLQSYRDRLTAATFNAETATNLVVEDIIRGDEQLRLRVERLSALKHSIEGWRPSQLKQLRLTEAQEQLNRAAARRRIAEEVTTEQRASLHRHLRPLVGKILDLERCWFHNLRKAHAAADNALEESQGLFRRHEALKSELALAPGKAELNASVERLSAQKQTIETWRASQQKLTRLAKIQPKLDRATARKGLSDEATRLYGANYFEGLRVYLRGAGFIVAPSYLPPSAVFPSEDWIEGDCSYEQLADRADELMKKYRVLGTQYSGILFKDDTAAKSKIGCVCISWVRVTLATTKKATIVPVLGMSGKAPSKPDNPSSLNAALGALALPPFEDEGNQPFSSDKKPEDKVHMGHGPEIFNHYYDEIMTRANSLAINYRVRTLLKLRLPGRQAMLSYLGLNFSSTEVVSNPQPKLAEPSPGVARWHSLNCAEPAALAWISSFFVDGQDVTLCCPYEGADNPGNLGLKPKETCPWCATVELAYRSLKKTESSKEWETMYQTGMSTGRWDREITFAHDFSALCSDIEVRKSLPRNREDFISAYPTAVNANVAILRSLFKEVGLLTRDTIREGRPSLWE